MLFGGRRATNVPLVTQATSWQHGVFCGAIMSSEKTAAAAGTTGDVRFDPFAMLPFMGYNVGDYIAHWLKIGNSTDTANLPQIFWVNWFRKSADGRFLWPGFGENSRVLKWIIERLDGTGEGVDTPIGIVPSEAALDTAGLELSPADLAALLQVDAEAWRGEVPLIEDHFGFIGERLPAAMVEELRALEKRLAG